jgi:enoyl-CoA hydratase/carnithine racemase
MVIAAPNATFGLPEVQVGLYAAAGGLSRIMRTAGLQVASEIALTARRLTAPDALGYHLINKIAKSQESVVDEALEVAKRMASLSPDGIIITRAGLREAWETGSVERATQRTSERYDKMLFEGENMKIGVEAFAAKKKPLWVPSKI